MVTAKVVLKVSKIGKRKETADVQFQLSKKDCFVTMYNTTIIATAFVILIMAQAYKKLFLFSFLNYDKDVLTEQLKDLHRITAFSM